MYKLNSIFTTGFCLTMETISVDVPSKHQDPTKSNLVLIFTFYFFFPLFYLLSGFSKRLSPLEGAR